MKTLAFIAAMLFSGMLAAQTGNSEIGDPHIYYHYSNAEISDMLKKDPAAIRKLNFYYQKSFIVEYSKNSGSELYDAGTIDVQRFEDQRLENERKTIIVSANNDKIILLSKKELEEAYSQIK
jgi:hypothetical protein